MTEFRIVAIKMIASEEGAFVKDGKRHHSIVDEIIECGWNRIEFHKSSLIETHDDIVITDQSTNEVLESINVTGYEKYVE